MPSKDSQQKTRYAPIRMGNGEWLLRAACRGVPMKDGYSIFFPKISAPSGRPTISETGHPFSKAHHDAPNLEFYREALALCEKCPVIANCFREFTRDPIPRIGMYFGKTPSQRTRIQTKLRQQMLDDIRELVPYGVRLSDPDTEEARKVNSIHKALYGIDIPGYSDGFWDE